MKILCIGDVVGRPGREAIAKLLPEIKKEYNIELTIVNAENAAGGAGITPRIVEELLGYGCDVLTSGDHIWDKRELIEVIDQETSLLRPANLVQGIPGEGYCVVSLSGNIKAGVINLQGRVFMSSIECPFKTAARVVDKIQSQASIIIVDMHAEATSEKIALGHFLNGRVSAVVGTHTHVQTADETILSQGTAYITDLGMTGPCDSVIGQSKEKIIQRFLTGMPVRFEVATSDVQLQGVVIDIDSKTGKANSITRLKRRV